MTSRPVTISARLGVAFDSGVPVLVLVSMGPVAALTGPTSVVIWAVSALVGFLMSLMFADLASAYPRTNGGVAVLGAAVLRRRSTVLARIGQWSYWLGWSPALAINGLLVGSYTQRLVLPDTPAWTAVLIATAVLVASVGVNHLGLRVGGRMQLILLICVVTPVTVLFVVALARGHLDLGNFVPFAPPEGGWLSHQTWLAVAGGLFIAGWSAYGAELSLAYPTRYRRGIRDALHVTAVVGLASVVAFSVVPFLLLTTVGVDGVRQDPAAAFALLSESVLGPASAAVLAVLTLALVLGLNMIAIASAWTLHQMARSGDAWTRLGRLNRHGVPSAALRFDLAVNLGLLALITMLSRGNTAEVPIALLAAANVGYFVSMCVALVATWLHHRKATVRGPFRLRPGLMRLAPAIVVFNLVLLATAGYAWGWQNVAIGAVALTIAILVATWRAKSARVPQPAVVLPACWNRAGVLAANRDFPGEVTPWAGGHDGSARSDPVGSRSAVTVGAVDRPGNAGIEAGGRGQAEPGNRRAAQGLG